MKISLRKAIYASICWVVPLIFLHISMGRSDGAPDSNVAGLWKGTISHGTDSFSPVWNFTVTLEQTGTHLTGSALLESRGQFARFALNGRLDGSTIETREGAILEENSGELRGSWCMNRIIKLSLVGPNRLEGTWRSDSPGCTTGKVILKRNKMCDDSRLRSSRYYVAFIARKPTINKDRQSPGHAFVQWVTLDGAQKMSRAEAFGLYPRKNSPKVLFGSVPGEIKNEYIQKSGISGDVVLRLEVTEEEFRATGKIREQWSRRSNSGKQDYNLYLKNCGDFVDQVVHKLRESKPSIRIPDYTTFNPDAEVGPYYYIKELYRLNQEEHVPDSALSSACP